MRKRIGEFYRYGKQRPYSIYLFMERAIFIYKHNAKPNYIFYCVGRSGNLYIYRNRQLYLSIGRDYNCYG